MPELHDIAFTLNGEPGRLANDLQHYPYRDISHHLQTIDRYTTLAADQMRAEGRTPSLPGVVLHPPFAFLRNYVLRGGFRDGVPGLIISAMNARYVGLKFAKLWELEKVESSKFEVQSKPKVAGRTDVPE